MGVFGETDLSPCTNMCLITSTLSRGDLSSLAARLRKPGPWGRPASALNEERAHPEEQDVIRTLASSGCLSLAVPAWGGCVLWGIPA